MKAHKHSGENMANDTKIALIEQTTVHITESLMNISEEIKRLNNKIETRFDTASKENVRFQEEIIKRFDRLDDKFDRKIDKIDDKFDRALGEVNKRLWTNFLWTLAALFSLSSAIGGIIAKGFGWLG